MNRSRSASRFPKGNPLKISKPEDLSGRTVGVEIRGFEERKINELQPRTRSAASKASVDAVVKVLNDVRQDGS